MDFFRYVDELLYWSGRRMILDEYLQGELTPTRLKPSWVTTKKYVFQSDDGGLSILDTSLNSINILVTNHTIRQLNVRGYQCSHDLKYVLFSHNVKKVSQCDSYYIYLNSVNLFFFFLDFSEIVYCVLHNL